MTLEADLPIHGYKYRAMVQGDVGWDVYALQSGLVYLGHKVIDEFTGVFDAKTHKAVKVFQKRHKLKSDGIAGVITQRAIATKICPDFTFQYQIPKLQLKGQLEKEAAFWLGNHSAAYDLNDEKHNWDIGVSQRSTRYHSFMDGFNVSVSIDYLARHIRQTYNKYTKQDTERNLRLGARGLPIPDRKRRWELAAGSWNRPAWTAYLAGQPNSESAKPSTTEREWIEGYIDRVTIYSRPYYKNREYPS